MAGWQLLMVVIQHHDAMPWRGKTRRADMHRMRQTMVIAQHHAQLGLAVMVVDGHAQVVGEPADHLRVQWLAGAADDAQLALDRTGELFATGNQQPIRRGRTGQVGDRVFIDDPAGAFQSERAIVEGNRVPHGQRPGHAEIDAIGPPRVGNVPERVLGAQVHGVAHIALERDDGLERYRQRLGRAGGAGGEHQQERLLCAQQHRLAVRRVIGQFGPEAVVAPHDTFAFGPGDCDDGRAVGDLRQLGTVHCIGDYQRCARAVQAMFNRLGSERGKQRLIDRADAPRCQHDHQQFGSARQQARHFVTALDALGQQEVGETCGLLLQFGKGRGGAAPVLAFPEQRDAPRQRVTVTAFNTGIERLQIAGQCGVGGMLVIKLGSGSQILTHRFLSFCVFIFRTFTTR